jgi:hypothetical protein
MGGVQRAWVGVRGFSGSLGGLVDGDEEDEEEEDDVDDDEGEDESLRLLLLCLRPRLSRVRGDLSRLLLRSPRRRCRLSLSLLRRLGL